MIYKLLTLLLLFFNYFCVNAQVYRGIKKVEKYKSELRKLDTYLQIEPRRCASEIKSLRKEALAKGNKELDALLDIYSGTMYYYEGQSDSSIVYFDKAIKKANKIHNDQIRSSASIRRLFVLDDTGAETSIFLRLMTQEYEDAKKRKDTLNMIYGLNGIALYNEQLDSTKICIDTYMEAIRLARENHNDFEYGFLLNNRGLLKLRLKSPEEAYKDIQQGLKIAKRLENIRLELILRENLAYYYMEVDSIDRAEEEHLFTLNLANKRNFKHLAFNSLVNLGVLERQKGNYSKSDSLLKTALTLAHDDGLYYALSPIYLTLAQLRLQDKDYKGVDSFLDSAMSYAKHTSVNDIKEGYYQIKYSKFQQQGNFEEALSYYKKLTGFRDSLNRSGHIQIMNELQLKYDVEKEKREKVQERNAYEKKLTAEQLDNARLKQNIGISISIIGLIIGLFVIYYYRSKQKREMEFSSAMVNRLEEERGRIARDLHDGLGQSLVILKNRFHKLDSKDDRELKRIDDEFTNTIEEVRSISRSLIPPELRRLGLKKAIVRMLKSIEESTNIVVTTEIEFLDALKLDESQEIRIYRILQELTNNTVKHSQATSLKIEIESIDKGLKITYQDNGIGISEEKFSSDQKSIGIKSIEQRLRFMQGSIRYERVPRGMKAIMKIKL